MAKGQKVKRNGKSARAEKQVRVLNRKAGYPRYSSHIIREFRSVFRARVFETARIIKHVVRFGRRPPGNRVDW